VASKRIEGETIWEGKVKIFEILRYPETDKLYSWVHEMVDTDNRREFAGSIALLMRRADAISRIGSSIPRRFRFPGCRIFCRIFYSLTLHLCIDRSSKKNAIYGQEEPNH
jgi:hypothetical protein